MLTVTLTVRHPQPVDRHGDPTGPAPADTFVPECLVAPRSSSENTDLQDTAFTGLTAYAPAGTLLAVTDAVEVPGYDGQWQVDGLPGRWDLHGPPGGVEIKLKQVT